MHANNFEGCKLLLVEDDVVSRRLVRMILRKSGFEVEEAASGEQALVVLQDFEPEMVLMDVGLDGSMDGFQTCRYIREQEQFADMPVMFLTGRSDNDAVIKGFEAGGCDYIVKPFSPAEALARIRAHLEIRILNKRQRSLIAQLQEADRDKNLIIGFASHDLKNPLVSIRGLSEFLLKEVAGPLTGDQKEIVDSIHLAARSMFGLVSDMLDFSRLAAGKKKLTLEEVDFRQYVGNTVTLHQISASEKAITLDYETDENLGTVLLDVAQFRRVIENMVSNAIKYSPRETRVKIAVRKTDTGMSVSVADEGPGIPEEEMGKLFTNFGTTSVKPTGGEQSVGLGLSITKKIIEAHGGVIRVRNRPEGGAEFTVELPTASAPCPLSTVS